MRRQAQHLGLVGGSFVKSKANIYIYIYIYIFFLEVEDEYRFRILSSLI